MFMRVTIAEARVKRLIQSGLRSGCKPVERLSQLRERSALSDEWAVGRLERVFFGLADKTRLRMLQLMAKEELCSCEVMAALDLTQPNTSHHLGILEKSGLVKTRREGKWVFYEINPKAESLLTKAGAMAEEGS